jgi:hypothetical protein
MPPSALKSASDDLRNLLEFVTRTAQPASGGQATQKKRPRLERGQYCPLEIGHRVSRCPKEMLSRASNLVYGRSQRRSPGGLPRHDDFFDQLASRLLAMRRSTKRNRASDEIGTMPMALRLPSAKGVMRSEGLMAAKMVFRPRAMHQ